MHFEALFFIYGANLDYKFSDDERSLITEKFGQEAFKEAYHFYSSNPEGTIFTYIIDHIDVYYPTIDSKKKLKKDIIQLFKSDGKVCPFEKSFLDFFQKIIIKGPREISS